MIYSASTATANYRGLNSSKYFTGQTIRTIIGFIISILIIIFMKHKWLEKYAGLMLVISWFLLLLPWSPFGVIVNGARRWVNIMGLQFQPSEIARFTLVVYIARYLAHNKDCVRDLKNGLIPLLSVVGVTTLLILLEPDFSFSLLVIVITIIMLILARIPTKYLTTMLLIGTLLFGILALATPYRVERIKAFLLNDQASPKNRYQTIQSLISLGSGQITGMGLGQSQQKFFFLPEPYTDFIFAILGEETGFVGTSIVMILFLLLLYRGVVIARNSPDMFSYYLTTGTIGFIFVEAMINIGVVTGTLPVTGLPLPFISYGSSSQIVNLLSMAVIINISRHTVKKKLSALENNIQEPFRNEVKINYVPQY